MGSRRETFGIVVALLAALLAVAGVAAWRLAKPDPPDERSGDESTATEGRPGSPSVLAGRRDETRGRAGSEAGKETPARSDSGRGVLVRVAYAEGGAAEGVTVVATPPEGHGAEVVGVTDARGEVRLAVTWSEGGRVAVRRGGVGGSGDGASMPITPEVLQGANSIDLHPYLRRSLIVHVRRRGEPFLPRPFVLRVDGRVLTLREVDAERGVAIGVYDMAASASTSRLEFEPEGGVAVVVALPADDGQPGADVVVEVEPAGTPLDVLVVPPRTVDAQPYLERWDEGAGYFRFDRVLGAFLSSSRGEVRRRRIDDLPVGRYRVTEPLLGTMSEAVDVFARVAPVSVRLDVSRAGWVRGRIDVPPGVDGSAAEVWIWDGTSTETPPRGHTSADAVRGFEIPVPGDRPVTLEVHHPMLSPDPRSGTVTVTEPQDGLTLRLERGPMATIRLIPGAGSHPAPEPRVLLTLIRQEPAKGYTTTTHWVGATENRVRFGGYVPGTYDVVLDDGTNAPVVLQKLELGPGDVDLGERHLEGGFTIRLRVLTAPGAVPPRYDAFCERDDGPVRSMRFSTTDASGRNHALRGLAAGRYRVRFHVEESPLAAWNGADRVVEVGPGIDAEATIDFRPAPQDPPAESMR